MNNFQKGVIQGVMVGIEVFIIGFWLFFLLGFEGMLISMSSIIAGIVAGSFLNLK